MNEERGWMSRLPVLLIVLLAALGISVPRLRSASRSDAAKPTARDSKDSGEASGDSSPADVLVLLADYLGMPRVRHRNDSVDGGAQRPVLCMHRVYESMQHAMGLEGKKLEGHVQFLIATIPDPLASHLDVDVDSQLGVIQRAAQHSARKLTISRVWLSEVTYSYPERGRWERFKQSYLQQSFGLKMSTPKVTIEPCAVSGDAVTLEVYTYWVHRFYFTQPEYEWMEEYRCYETFTTARCCCDNGAPAAEPFDWQAYEEQMCADNWCAG